MRVVDEFEQSLYSLWLVQFWFDPSILFWRNGGRYLTWLSHFLIALACCFESIVHSVEDWNEIVGSACALAHWISTRQYSFETNDERSASVESFSFLFSLGTSLAFELNRSCVRTNGRILLAFFHSFRRCFGIPLQSCFRSLSCRPVGLCCFVGFLSIDSFRRSKVFKFSIVSLEFLETLPRGNEQGLFFRFESLPLLSHPAKDRSRLRNTFVYSLSSVKGLF